MSSEFRPEIEAYLAGLRPKPDTTGWVAFPWAATQAGYWPIAPWDPYYDERGHSYSLGAVLKGLYAKPVVDMLNQEFLFSRLTGTKCATVSVTTPKETTWKHRLLSRLRSASRPMRRSPA